MKKCIVCNKDFEPHKLAPHTKCCSKECKKEWVKKSSKKYYYKNKEKIKERSYTSEYKKKRRKYEKEYRNKNKDMLSKYQRHFYSKHKKRLLKEKKIWQDNHPEIRKAYYKKNKKRLLKRSSERAKELRLKAIEYYSNGKMECNCCREKHYEFLTIDHLPNAPHKKDNKKKGGREVYYWLKKYNYPEGFQILCMNCNFALGKYGYCPHQKGGIYGHK